MGGPYRTFNHIGTSPNPAARAGGTAAAQQQQRQILFTNRRTATQPNLRQVHLIHAELHDELAAGGFTVAPGDLGENVTTRGLDLLALPTGTRLHLGAEAIVELTGLRREHLPTGAV